jgi:hypothetical protein
MSSSNRRKSLRAIISSHCRMQSGREGFRRERRWQLEEVLQHRERLHSAEWVPLHRERRWQLEEVLYRERLHSAEWLPLHRERRQRRFRQRLRWAPEAVRPRLQPVQAFCTIFRGNRSCGGFLA